LSAMLRELRPKACKRPRYMSSICRGTASQSLMTAYFQPGLLPSREKTPLEVEAMRKYLGWKT
jgi:hypothetical protein